MDDGPCAIRGGHLGGLLASSESGVGVSGLGLGGCGLGFFRGFGFFSGREVVFVFLAVTGVEEGLGIGVPRDAEARDLGGGSEFGGLGRVALIAGHRKEVLLCGSERGDSGQGEKCDRARHGLYVTAEAVRAAMPGGRYLAASNPSGIGSRPYGQVGTMDLNLTSLWIKIENFDIDGEKVALPFVKRLARENGWTIRFAERAIEEYRKFLFLAMAAEHPVTPSKAVDEVWHLHLTYTISYWERLTKEVLPRPLHHHPTKGGKSESSKHEDQYVRTLAAYERYFGAPAPQDLWPRRGSVPPKHSAWKSWLKGAAVALGGASVVAGCMPFIGQSGGGGSTLWMVLGGVGVVIVGGIFWAMRSADSGMAGPIDPAGPNPDPRREHTGYAGSACSSASSGHFIDHGGSHSETSGAGDTGSGDSGSGDSAGGDSGGSGCGSGCGGGGGCSS